MLSHNPKTLRFNIFVNIIDGGFFGLAIGFASFTTIIPLFVSTLTDSATLIGLIPAVHNVGWQLPQLITAQKVARLRLFKPTVMWMTINERIPFLCLAILAWFLPNMENWAAILIIYFLLIWQGLGGGFAANPWQNLIVRIIPIQHRAKFFGTQSASANLLAAAGAAAAGVILEKLPSPLDFSVCFTLAFIWMGASWFMLNLTREPVLPVRNDTHSAGEFLGQIGRILGQNKTFRWFLVSRMLSQFAMMAFAFYTVYAVRVLDMSEVSAGILTSVLLLTQVVANPLLGWLADHTSRRVVLEAGAITAALSALLAWLAQDVNLFYAVIALSGLASTAFVTIGLVYSTEFGDERDRPAYIGLSNTLVAPATILAPLLGGWLADEFGFRATFLAAVVAALITALIFHLFVHGDRIPAGHNAATYVTQKEG